MNDSKHFLIGAHPGFDLAREAANMMAARLDVVDHDLGGDGVAGHVQNVSSVLLPDGAVRWSSGHGPITMPFEMSRPSPTGSEGIRKPV